MLLVHGSGCVLSEVLPQYLPYKTCRCGTYPSQANIQKRGKWVTAGASFVQYQQVGTALNHQLFHAQVMKNSLSQVISNPISHSPVYVR